jgi:UrcA family protein
MPNIFSPEARFPLALAAATALALILAAAPASVLAAEYDDEDYAEDAQDTAPAAEFAASDEEVIVRAPRMQRRGEYGAPLRDVSMSRTVSIADLDLTTADGVRILETRIRSTARNLCRQLDVMHPVKADNSPPCYQAAVQDAMYQAEDAIAQARNAEADLGADLSADTGQGDTDEE